jgi:hypothetical protein
MKARSKVGQGGVSLVGLILALIVFGGAGLLGLKIVPTVSEFMSVKKAIGVAKNAGSTPNEIRNSFDKQAETGYIESISGKELVLVKSGDGYDISFAYERRIPLAGPASLVLDYQGTTAANGVVAKKAPE